MKLQRITSVLLVLGGLVAAAFSMPALAQGSDTEIIEEVVTIGTRLQEGRSASDSLVPVDLISGDDLQSQGATTMDDLLSRLVPSYNVNQQPINDAATLVRPAQLRGLPPDATLVLVNGKRRHRAAVITFLGNGVADGSQGPDISTIPAIALKRVEVLRDGAAAQYGSDAIAGVINFQLKDYDDGGSAEARWGQYYEGDGDAFNLAANVGISLGAGGFLNLSAEYKQSDPTNRSQQRTDAAALIAAGNPHEYAAAQYITDPSYDSTFHPNVMIWGAPEFRDDYKLFANFGKQLGSILEIYGHANYAQREVEGGFFYRNPHTRSGVFAGGKVERNGIMYDTVKVADLDGIGMGRECPAIRIIDGVASIDDINLVKADPNCESFITRFPGGFVPRFGGSVTDYSFATGVRGEFIGWHFDVSGVWGSHEADYFMRHTINPQLLALPGITVANIPTDYDPGGYTQTDWTLNLDLSRSLDLGFLHGPLNLAFGVEVREEQFEVTQGGMNSWYQDLSPGGLSAQGFGVGSNGFAGFGPRVVGTWSRESYAGYVDLEAEVTDVLVLGLAGRFEDHDDVGDTLDFKISGRLQTSEDVALRAAFSTGFRAPTVGQANILNVTTAFTQGILEDEATLPPTHPASALVGGQPLTPEESTSFSLGMVINAGNLDITMDYYRIKLEDRIARSSERRLTEQQRNDLVAAGVTDAANFSQIRFYTNDFDTTTQGLDIVATWDMDMFGGNTVYNIAANLTDTNVDKRNPAVIDEKRVIQLEENIPGFRVTGSFKHTNGAWDFVGRVRFYSDFVEFATDDGGARLDAGARTLLDLSMSYAWDDDLTFVFGADNVLDKYPSTQTAYGGNVSGLVYSETSPYGFNGGYYYFRALWGF